MNFMERLEVDLGGY